MDVLFIEGRRNGYTIEQCGTTLTVEDLNEYLEQFDPEPPIYICNDNGYTYGSITYSSFDLLVGYEEEK